MVVLNSDGGIAPCCFLFFKEDDFGFHAQEPLKQVRTNETFLTARKLFNETEAGDLPVDMRHPCLKCELVHTQPFLQKYLETNPHAQKGHRTGGA